MLAKGIPKQQVFDIPTVHVLLFLSF